MTGVIVTGRLSKGMASGATCCCRWCRNFSNLSHLVAMYLSGYRVWFAAILGIAVGAAAALALASFLS